MKVLVLYHSKTGHTLEAVNATAEGIRSTGSEAKVVDVSNFSGSDLLDYEAIIFGSPCWAGSVALSGVATPLSEILDALPEGSLKKKRCGGISVHSKMGGTRTVNSLGELLSRKGCDDYRPGPVAKAGVPFSLWTGPSVSSQDEERFRAYGVQFVA